MVGTLGHSNDTFMYLNVFIRHIVTPKGVKTGRIASMPQNKRKAHQNIKTFLHMQFPFKTFKSYKIPLIAKEDTANVIIDAVTAFIFSSMTNK